ncbi:MAG: hypothetical protein NUV58_04815 [Candidatus Roizmanbacteria bacterium]|nr:hypothetical protein [Candidatus Roizmanbacteria bacterium]
MSKKYIISATVFDSKKEMEDKIQVWIDLGTYNEQSVVYEIGDTTPEYMGVIKLQKLQDKTPEKKIIPRWLDDIFLR